jgi:hypothetical protein
LLTSSRRCRRAFFFERTMQTRKGKRDKALSLLWAENTTGY